jgi:1,2-diacylglycerol-3-alpha-glucose alpha-1,2-glucosyltransferase
MKVCLFLEASDLFGHTGIGSALEHQKMALELAGVSYTTDPKDEYDILHINTIGPMSLLYAKKMKSRGKKIIMHAHTLEEDTRNSFTFSTSFSPLFRRYLKFFYKQADLIITPSEYTKMKLGEYGLKNDIAAISNGVDLDKFHFDKSRREDYRGKYALSGTVPFSVGHLFPRKGVKTFINVARGFDNTFVWFGRRFGKILVGSRELDSEIRNKPDNVIFTGFVEDIVAAYCSGDIFFFPSLAETQGIVILEAMATKRPVLIRDLPVYEGWLKHGRDCLKASNDGEFTHYLDSLINDRRLRGKLVSNANKTVKGHSLDKVGDRLREVYEGVLKK